MWKYIVERGRQQMAIWRIRIACWITKSTNTHSQYVTLLAFPPQQWLQEGASVLRYTYIACLVCTVRLSVLNSHTVWYGSAKKHSACSWVKRDKLDATCFIITLFSAQHVSDVNTSILRSLRLMYWAIEWVVLIWFDVCWCYVAVWQWWCGIRMQAEACIRIPHHHSHTAT